MEVGYLWCNHTLHTPRHMVNSLPQMSQQVWEEASQLFLAVPLFEPVLPPSHGLLQVWLSRAFRLWQDQMIALFLEK